MSKFNLSRVERLMRDPPPADITLGVEAAAYLHWITCYEHDPKKFVAVEETLPAIRQHVADYFALTARETAAHIELMQTAHAGKPSAVGTKDFQSAAPDDSPPGRVARLDGNYGLNFGYFWWKPPADGGQPWGYRLYRTTKVDRKPPDLVHTTSLTEALVPDQPRQIKFYYYITAFNGAGESPAGPDFGVMFDDPDEPWPSGRD